MHFMHNAQVQMRESPVNNPLNQRWYCTDIITCDMYNTRCQLYECSALAGTLVFVHMLHVPLYSGTHAAVSRSEGMP